MRPWLDVFLQPVELTEERWQHIVTEHPEVIEHKEKIPIVLADPDYVKRSKRDEHVILTRSVMKGETLWEKS